MNLLHLHCIKSCVFVCVCVRMCVFVCVCVCGTSNAVVVRLTFAAYLKFEHHKHCVGQGVWLVTALALWRVEYRFKPPLWWLMCKDLEKVVYSQLLSAIDWYLVTLNKCIINNNNNNEHTWATSFKLLRESTSRVVKHLETQLYRDAKLK